MSTPKLKKQPPRRFTGREVAMQAIGSLLDQLGVTAEIDDADLIASAVVVMAVLVSGDNNPRLAIASSEGISWIEQAGLLRLAERIVSEPPEGD